MDPRAELQQIKPSCGGEFFQILNVIQYSVRIPERFGAMTQFSCPKALLERKSQVVERGGHEVVMGSFEDFNAFRKMQGSEVSCPSTV